eukprot:7708520-Pyramimonas_sp.AAC.1
MWLISSTVTSGALLGNWRADLSSSRAAACSGSPRASPCPRPERGWAARRRGHCAWKFSAPSGSR